MGGPLHGVRLDTTGGSAREEYIRILTAAASYAFENEPGVLKYCILVPRDASDEKSVFEIAEYANQAALDAHMATKWMTSTPVLETAPTFHQLKFIDGFHFTRPTIRDQSDPHIIFATLDYKPDTVPVSLPYWKAVVDTSANDEPGTLVYGICKDPNNKDKLYTIEAHNSEEYLKDVHVKSDAIAESIKNTKHLRNGLTHTFLKLEAGFLYRDNQTWAQGHRQAQL